MDKTLRRNEKCVISLPRCDFAFSSTRTCFIAYGFQESPLEMQVISDVLEDRGIQPIQAAANLAPGQNAFCGKICSKIITAQFCIVLLNNNSVDGHEVPNANVNMEYGLMLGFNKYIVPFQRASQKLPFNVAGLDTIKYTDTELKRLAAHAIDLAIAETQQDRPAPLTPDQLLEAFLLSQKALVSTTIGEEGNLFRLGSPLGFNLLNDFTGLQYMYFGNFTPLRPEVVIQRVNMLNEILDSRASSMDVRVNQGFVTEDQAVVGKNLFASIQVWVLVTTDEDKRIVTEALGPGDVRHIRLFSIDEIALDRASIKAT